MKKIVIVDGGGNFFLPPPQNIVHLVLFALCLGE